MSHLLTISIGPVQDFIAAARRTADLYAGSQILQELSKHAAQHLAAKGAQLIFPADQEADGANKILAEVTKDPKALAQEVKEALRKELEDIWKDTLSKLPESNRNHIDEQRAKKQLEHFLEFYAAWVPLGKDYANAREEVERLLAGRKALRDFSPTNLDDDGLPKSPFDPARATVLLSPKEQQGKPLEVPSVLVYDPKLRFNKTEFLDAVSLLKRVYGVQELLGKVPQTRTLARMATVITATNAENLEEDLDDKQKPLDSPYFAILLADGDRMGARLGELKTIEAHQDFSRKLSRFAQSVQGLLEKTVYEENPTPKPHPYRFCVYSGGDDVLAFLPVNRAVACAKALYSAFKKIDPALSLSIGIAIVHYREPLSISLEAAREAEKAAKNKSAPKHEQGNRLAVALHTRGGVPLTVVRSWDELSDPRLDWETLVQAYRQQAVSRGLAYELRELAREWLDEMGKEALNAEARRILERKKGRGLELPEFRKAKDLEIYANQLIIARFLSGIKEEAHAGTGA